MTKHASSFSVHTTTRKWDFLIYPLWRAFSKTYVFLNKNAVSVWTEGQNGEKICVFTRKRISEDMALIANITALH